MNEIAHKLRYEDLVPVKWVTKGMTVYCSAHKDNQIIWIACKVTGAHGYHAQIFNEKKGVDRLIHIDDLLMAPIK